MGATRMTVGAGFAREPRCHRLFAGKARSYSNSQARLSQPPVIDMKRITCAGFSVNSWRSGFSAMA